MRRIDVVRAFADCPELLAANNAITELSADVCYKVRVRARYGGSAGDWTRRRERSMGRASGSTQYDVPAGSRRHDLTLRSRYERQIAMLRYM